LEGLGTAKTYFAIGQSQFDGVFDGNDLISVEMCHYLKNCEGIFVGGTSGLNVVGAGK
jgi:cysteine synthase